MRVFPVAVALASGEAVILVEHFRDTAIFGQYFLIGCGGLQHPAIITGLIALVFLIGPKAAMARDMPKRHRQFLGRQASIQGGHPKLPRVKPRKAQRIALCVGQKPIFLEKHTQLRHALAAAAHYTAHAAKLAPKLVGRGSFLIGFWCVEGPGATGDDLPLRYISFDQRPTAGRNTKINTQALHRFPPIHSRRKKIDRR